MASLHTGHTKGGAGAQTSASKAVGVTELHNVIEVDKPGPWLAALVHYHGANVWLWELELAYLGVVRRAALPQRPQSGVSDFPTKPST